MGKPTADRIVLQTTGLLSILGLLFALPACMARRTPTERASAPIRQAVDSRKPVPAKAAGGESQIPPATPAPTATYLSLAPTIGNGIRPVSSALDTRRHRLFVFNAFTWNVSVVDLSGRKVVAVVSLPNKYYDFPTKGRLLYDSKADRLYLLARIEDRRGRIRADRILIVISARTLAVLAARTFSAAPNTQESYTKDFALDPQRGELYLSDIAEPHGGKKAAITVLDARALRVKRHLYLPYLARRELAWVLTALQCDPVRRRLYAAFAAHPERDNGEVRVLAIDPDTGAVTPSERFPGMIEHLLLDPIKPRLIAIGQSSGEQQASDVTILGLPTLQKLRQWKPIYRDASPSENNTTNRLWIEEAQLDAGQQRLMVKGDGGLGVLDLRKANGQEVRFLPNTKRSDCLFRFAQYDSQARQSLTFSGNALLAFDLTTRREAWRVTLGTDIAQMFLDRQRHRLALTMQTDRRQLWLEGEKPQFPFSEGNYNLEEMFSEDTTNQPIAIDFAHQWLYMTAPSLVGASYYMTRRNFQGVEDYDFHHGNEGTLCDFALTPDGKRSYRLLFPTGTDVEEPKAFVGIYDGKELVKTIPVGALSNLFYVAAKDEVYVARGSQYVLLAGGKTITFPENPPASAIANAPLFPRVPPQSKRRDTDAAGEYVYEVFGNQIVKIRIADSAVLAAKLLDFNPYSIAVDSEKGSIYLLDWRKGRIARMSSF